MYRRCVSHSLRCTGVTVSMLMNDIYTNILGNRIVMSKRTIFGIQFMQQMSGEFTHPGSWWSALTNARDRYRHPLCSNFVSNQPGYEPAPSTSSGCSSAGLDRFGRRRLFMANALGMCAVLVAEAICVGINNPKSAIAAVVCIFVFEACFAWGKAVRLWSPYVLAHRGRLDGDCLVLHARNTLLKIRPKGAAPAAQHILQVTSLSSRSHHQRYRT